MKWMEERDLLIAQTMAFVQSVTGKAPDAGMLSGARKPAQAEVSPAPEAAVVERALAVQTDEPSPAVDISFAETMIADTLAAPASPPPMPMPPVTSEILAIPSAELPPAEPIRIVERQPELADFQSEIRARVANFRANQQRFLSARQAYSDATMDKVRAILRENGDLPPGG